MATAGAVPVVTVQGSREARPLPTLPPFRPASCAAIPNNSEPSSPSSPSLQTFPGSNQPELRPIEATLQERLGTGIHLPPGTCRSRRCPRPSLVRPALERGVRLLQTVHRNDADAMRHESQRPALGVENQRRLGRAVLA